MPVTEGCKGPAAGYNGDNSQVHKYSAVLYLMQPFRQDWCQADSSVLCVQIKLQTSDRADQHKTPPVGEKPP